MTPDQQTGQPESTLKRIAVLWWRVLRAGYLRYGFSGAVLWAAAIAFFSLICLAPLGILLAAVLQIVLGPGSNVYQQIEEVVSALGPDTAGQIMPQVDNLLRNPDAYLTGVSSIALVWAGLRLFETLERSLTGIWPGRVLRSYLRRKLVALSMMLVAGLLLGGFVLFTALLAAAQSRLQQISGLDARALGQARPRFLLAYQFGASYVAFALLYKFMPVQRVPTRVALAGGTMAAVLWQAASLVFTHVMALSHRQGTFYGGLAGIVVFSLWALLGAQVLMFGAQFAVAYEHVFLKRRPPEEDDELISWPQRLADLE